jgi:hypothetical protein
MTTALDERIKELTAKRDKMDGVDISHMSIAELESYFRARSVINYHIEATHTMHRLLTQKPRVLKETTPLHW